jgi:uncharacterized protein Usg
MSQASRPLRVLSPQERTEVNSFYKLMAVSLARATSVVLTRNQFVEATIAELLETVPDKFLLLSAWVAWFQNREEGKTLKELRWHVTQFQRELDGSLAAVEDEYKQFQKFPKDALRFRSYDELPIVVAYRLLEGGAQ